MKLSTWAKKQGVSYRTAWNWYRQGKLPVSAYQVETGTIIVEDGKPTKSDLVWIYCRVSSRDKKDDLSRQVKRCSDFCAARGWQVVKSVKEIASGMNDHRPKMLSLLNENPSRIVVEHKDRLTRFGFGYLENLLPKTGCELVVINRDEEEQSDLMKDLVAVITSFCCRLYGLRRGNNKAARIKKELSCEEPSK
jgi:putative resolvase